MMYSCWALHLGEKQYSDQLVSPERSRIVHRFLKDRARGKLTEDNQQGCMSLLAVRRR